MNMHSCSRTTLVGQWAACSRLYSAVAEHSWIQSRDVTHCKKACDHHTLQPYV